MASDFQIIKPPWENPGVRAYLVTALSEDNERVTFDGQSCEGSKFRSLLEQKIHPLHPVSWIRQVHGNNIVRLPVDDHPEADGSFTTQKGVVCEVITADCLPIVFSDFAGTRVGIVHAGRRGLYLEIIARMVAVFGVPPGEIMVWIGPGISRENYVISKEICDQFLSLSSEYSSVFHQVRETEYGMDLYQTAKIQLSGLGIPQKNISGAEWDTFSDDRFHSARRNHEQAGRMATVVWMEKSSRL
ncbi:MAG TPA: peptidoglycan editing factor PgeF [Prolixibacteraceae bacterium]|nr:peptidoglycan editing factor PgeF [Prolixibacteraceae bacterium]